MGADMKEKRILLAFFDSLGVESRNCSGIFRYARPHCRWVFLRMNPNLPGFMRSSRAWRPHGAIGRVGREDLVRKAVSLRIPFVNIYGGRRFRELSQVGTDDRAIGRTAADHLARLGFPHFGYFGLRESGRGGFARERGEGFAAELRARGRTVHEFDGSRRYPGKVPRVAHIIRGEDRWHRWLVALPKPVGIFACDDLRAVWLLDSCYRLGLRVPEEVAVLGANGDEIHCQQAWPPLSSVGVPAENEGYEAARLLERMLLGRRPPAEPVLLLPEPVRVAASTDFVAVTDPALGKALSYMREHATQRCRVEEVARHAGISRRVLENRFRSELDTTPFKEFRLIQMDRLCRLLRETSDSLEAIAERAGYSSRTRLATDFRQRMGMSPSRYRKQHGGRSL